MYVNFLSVIKMIKRKKLQYILITLIIALSATLIYVGLSLMGQTSPFQAVLERANGTENMLMVNTYNDEDQQVIRWYEEKEQVKDVVSYKTLMCDMRFVQEDENLSNLIFLTEYNSSTYDRLFESETTEAKAPKAGEIYLNYNHAAATGLSEGDEVECFINDQVYNFTVAKLIVDPHYSTPFLSPNRCFVQAGFFESAGIKNDMSMIGIKFHDISQVDEIGLQEALMESGILSTSPVFVDYKTFAMSYNLIANIIASILIGVSLFIAVVVLFVIRVTIRNHIIAHYRKIGVKKVLGYSNKLIRRDFVWLFTTLALIATAIGIAIGIPLRNMINRQMTYDIQLGVGGGFESALFLTVIVVVLLISLFTFIAVKPVSLVQPVQAIKYGMPESAMRPHKFTIVKHKKVSLNILLALKQMLVNRRKTVTSTLILTILMYIGFVVNHTGFTLAQEAHFTSHLIGVNIGDFAVGEVQGKTKSDVYQALEQLDYVENTVYMTNEINYSTETTTGSKVNLGVTRLFGDINDGLILINEGRLPVNQEEILISSDLAGLTGKTTGDYIDISNQGDIGQYFISGIYNGIMNGGSNIIFVNRDIMDAEIYQNGNYWVYNSQLKSIEQIQKDVIGVLGDSVSVDRYDSNVKNILSTLSNFPALINTMLFIFLIICGAVILNLTMMDINDSKKNYGIMKALGYRNRDIYQVLMTRSVLMIAVSTVVSYVVGSLSADSIMKLVFSVTPFSSITLPVILDYKGSVILIILFILSGILGTILPGKAIGAISPKQLISE